MTTTTIGFPHHTVDSAPERSRSVLREQQQQFGFVASPLARHEGSGIQTRAFTFSDPHILPRRRPRRR